MEHLLSEEQKNKGNKSMPRVALLLESHRHSAQENIGASLLPQLTTGQKARTAVQSSRFS